MNRSQFVSFLQETLGNIARVMRDGAIAYVCMDWRHMAKLTDAGKASFTELKNLVVWNKTNGGMGAFYRSKHELVFVFKQGTAPCVDGPPLARCKLSFALLVGAAMCPACLCGFICRWP